MTKIAIDGPAGAGKSTISKQVAKSLGYIYIDTGAMYRAVGLKVLREDLDTNKESDVLSVLNKLDIDIKCTEKGQLIFLDGEDVSTQIRTPDVSMAASNVSKIGKVREKLVDLQRSLANNNNVVMDGRDIGTCVLPDAQIKIFLTASADARAERRYKELVEKGERVSFEEVKQDIIDRDNQDTNRKISPLKMAEDAVLIDTSLLSLEESVSAVINHIKEYI